MPSAQPADATAAKRRPQPWTVRVASWSARHRWPVFAGWFIVTIGLFVGLTYFFWGRVTKAGRMFKFTHISDWLFIIMLFLTTLTGILLHFFRIFGMPAATYYMYIIHMAILVPMLVIEVPFSKWSHLAYRPFAIYFSRIRRRQK